MTKSKINFKLIHKEENNPCNGQVIELIEIYEVPKWLAKKAEQLIGQPENGIISTTENTIEWGCATGIDIKQEGEWENFIDSMWSAFTEEMKIVDRPRILEAE